MLESRKDVKSAKRCRVDNEAEVESQSKNEGGTARLKTGVKEVGLALKSMTAACQRKTGWADSRMLIGQVLAPVTRSHSCLSVFCTKTWRARHGCAEARQSVLKQTSFDSALLFYRFQICPPQLSSLSGLL